MATEDSGSSSPGLIRRPAILAASTAAASSGLLGGIFIAPTVAHDFTQVLSLATSTGEGVATIVGLGVGLAATGLTGLGTKSHWVTNTTTDCGVVNPEKTIQKTVRYSTRTYTRCEHDGSGRRNALRGIGVPALAVGLAATLVGGLAVNSGFEHGPASVIEELGTALAAAGGVAGLSSFIKHRAPRGLSE